MLVEATALDGGAAAEAAERAPRAGAGGAAEGPVDELTLALLVEWFVAAGRAGGWLP
jgi:hypothetical protein